VAFRFVTTCSLAAGCQTTQLHDPEHKDLNFPNLFSQAGKILESVTAPPAICERRQRSPKEMQIH